ncbi:MAG: T9SS type A sorting domain-containing protein [Bacteroidota bacterium]
MINAFSRSYLFFTFILFSIYGLWATPSNHHPPLLWSNSPYSFTESAITAVPGETVQICVDKQLGGIEIGTTLATVQAIGNTNPHLSGFTSETLYFPVGVTQACFDLTLQPDQESVDYQLTIHGSSEYQDIHVIYEQQIAICGVVPSNGQTSSVSGSSPAVQDRFGNYYTAADFNLLGGGGSSCDNSGYFDLFFSSGFTDQEVETICQVFSDLSLEFSSEQDGIPISISKSVLGNGVLAFASPTYVENILNDGCGIENSAIWQMINSSSSSLNTSPLPLGIPAGFIGVNSIVPFGNNWHTIDEDQSPTDPDVDTNEYDLYSVVMHEALHLLGFASRIRLTGGPTSGFYSRWDKLLYGTTTNTFLINSSASEECCDFHEFNFTDYPNLPEDVTNSCSSNPLFQDIVCGSDHLATINGGPNTPQSNGEFLNALSHIDKDCDQVPYVMHYSFGSGEARREITLPELNILCELGYEVEDSQASCNSCIVFANDDYLDVSGGGSYQISALSLLLNDENLSDLTSSGFSIEIDLNAEDALDAGLEEAVPGSLWNVTSSIPGTTYRFLYRLTACNGICDEGYIYFRVGFSVPPCPEIENSCTGENLFCHSDIEAFESNQSFFGLFHSSMNIDQLCNPAGGIEELNTVDIWEQNGNNYLHIGYEPDPLYLESAVVPLTQGIQPGCRFTVEFDARINPVFAQLPGTFDIHASNLEACLVPDVLDCPGSGDQNTFHCLEVGVPFVSPSWSSFSFELENNSSEPFNYILITNNGPDQPTVQGLGIDNIVIRNTGCTNDMSITPTIASSCADNIVVEYEICLLGDATVPTTIVLETDLEDEAYITALGGDFIGGTATIENYIPGDECVTMTLTAVIDELYPPGITVDIPLSIIAANSCSPTFISTSVETTDCSLPTFTCQCEGENSININAGNGTHWQDTELANIASSTLLSPNTIELGNRCVAISGNLLLGSDATNPNDIDLVFLGGSLRMQPEASIIVQSGADIGFLNVNAPDDQGNGIHSCDYMWQGITVESGGTLRLGDNQIEDALQAIVAKDQSSILVAGNIFMGNTVGIHVPYSGGGSTEVFVFPNGIIGNTFDNGGGFLGSLDGTIAPGSMGGVGINLDQTAWFPVGSPNAQVNDRNQFRNLTTGIYATSSFFGTFNTDFNQIGATGIFARRLSFLVARNNNFDDMNRGMWVQGFGVLASNNAMSNLNFGASFRGGPLASVEFFNNNIAANTVGIEVLSARATNRLRIENNVLTLTPGASSIDPVAISILDEMEGAIVSDGELRANRITINGRGEGIRLDQAGNIGVYYDTIHYQNPIAAEEQGNGIVLRNSDANYLYENIITSTTGFTNVNGISLIAAEDNLLCCNKTTGTTQGVRFQGNCDPTHLRTTTMEDHTTGLRCELGTIIGLQTNTGTRWLGDYAPFKAIHDGEDFDVIPSVFFVNFADGSTVGPSPSEINTPNSGLTWFQPIGGQTPDCTQNIDDLCGDIPEPFQGGGTGLTNTDISLAKGEYSTGTFATFQNWEKGMQLYGKLTRDLSLVSSNVFINSFFTNNGDLGAHFDVKENLRLAYIVPGNRQAQFDQEFAGLQSLLQLLDQNAAQYQQASSELDSTQLLLQREQLLTSLHTSWNEISTIHSEQNVAIQTDLDAIKVQNSSLLNLNLPASNQKSVTDIVLRNIGLTVAEYDAADIQALESIAYECPLLGGNAVFRARTVLKELGTYNFTDDLSNCQPAALQAIENKEPLSDHSLIDFQGGNIDASSKKWTAYPNPTTSQITITGRDFSKVKSIRLYDLSGKLYQEWLKSSLVPTFSLENVIDRSGVYYLDIEEIGGTTQAVRVVIIR